MSCRPITFYLLAILAFFNTGYAIADIQWSGSEFAEQQLIEVIDAIEHGADDKAYQLAAELTASYPTFQLAQLIYGDLLSARGMRPVLFNDQRKRELNKLREEARARLSHEHLVVNDTLVANNLLMLSDEYQYVLVFELEKSRLYLFKNQQGTPRLVDNYYTSMGKAGIGKQVEGDNKTPLGVYRIISYLPDKKLPELYGAGAYPINYPNSWDRLHGKTGHGIWLHGVPRNTYSRPPLDSEGCVVVSNVNLQKIGNRIDLGKTPVVLARNVRWVSHTENKQLRTTLQNHFEAWRQDWMSLDVEAYLQHYSADFSTSKYTLKSWQTHKRKIAPGKSFIEVKTTQEDMFVYPDTNNKKPLIVIRFEQRYRSNNFSSVSHKQQFWRQENDGQWRIVYEGV